MPEGNPQVGERWMRLIPPFDYRMVSFIDARYVYTRPMAFSSEPELQYGLNLFLETFQLTPSYTGKRYISNILHQDLAITVIADYGDRIDVEWSDHGVARRSRLPVSEFLDSFTEVFVGTTEGIDLHYATYALMHNSSDGSIAERNI